MIGAIVAVLFGLKLWVPIALRNAAFIILGVQIGSSVSMDTLATAARWPLSLVMLAVTITTVTAACHLFYRRMRGWPTADALFSSLPGALGLVVALADAAKADMRRVIIAQSIRLFFLVAALPLLINSLSSQRTPRRCWRTRCGGRSRSSSPRVPPSRSAAKGCGFPPAFSSAQS